MPTSANKGVLDRDLSVAGIKSIADIGDPLLVELVNYSTNALLRCATSNQVKNRIDYDLAPIALYRQLIEMADGIQVLTSQSIGTAAIPVVRSMFEMFLGLEFILEPLQDYDQRSLSWIVGYARDRIFSYKQLSSQTTEGQQFKKHWEADSIASTIALPFTDKQINTAIVNLEALLAKPHIQPVNGKFEAYKAARNRNPNWFSIDGGPNNIEELAIHLNRGALYNLLYRYWSGVTHGTDFSSFIAPKDKKGRSGMKGLRDAKSLKDIYTFSASFMIEATKKMLLKFRPGEEAGLTKWYESEVRDRYLKISKLKVEIIHRS